jgi:hypothetical protein
MSKVTKQVEKAADKELAGETKKGHQPYPGTLKGTAFLKEAPADWDITVHDPIKQECFLNEEAWCQQRINATRQFIEIRTKTIEKYERRLALLEKYKNLSPELREKAIRAEELKRELAKVNADLAKATAEAKNS